MERPPTSRPEGGRAFRVQEQDVSGGLDRVGGMPSFQTRLKITGLRPGNPPEAVMDAAVEALGTRHHVEAHQLQLAGGVPQLNLRFLVEASEYSGENRQAVESAAMMRDAVERVALTGSLSVLRRSRGKWLPV